MRARLRSWWQQIQKHPFISTGIIVALLVLLGFIFSAYHFDWSGTGFLNKTLWDWLQLLIIPLALAVIALVFQLANTRAERQIAKERYEQDQQISLDKQHEDLLQTYLDRMSELLLKEKLRSSEINAEVRNVARVRTITVLTQLDTRRIGYVFTFLDEAGLMSRTSNDNVMSLKEADLRGVNWSQADLTKADLRGANLSGANLRGANLSGANLRGANLSGANLIGTLFSSVKGFLSVRSKVNIADLSEADLSDADLRAAILKGVNLSRATIVDANLRNAQLTEANLSSADLRWANLSGADLSTTVALCRRDTSLKPV
jgi:uncharacterized protein YjbI with pentapeptide repeats